MKVSIWRRVATPVLLLAALLAPLFVAALASAQVVIPPIAPPKPAAPRVANATSIGIGDLSEAVNFAVQGNFAETRNSFTLFKDDWTAVAPEVERQSSDIADMVMDAINEVQILVDATPPSAQATYLPAIRKLADVVEEANSQLALIAPVTSALHIPTPDLGQSVSWASQGNLAKAHDEFTQFQDDWSLIKETVRQALPAGADTIDAATTRVQNQIANPANPDPAQAEYFGALQALQQAVNDANTQLVAQAPSTPRAQASLVIRVRDLAEAVELAGDEDLAGARSEFGQFMNGWSSVAGPVREQHADIADMVDEAIARVETIFGAANPAKTDYFPALQDLQMVVENANGALAAAPIAAPALAPIAPPGPAPVADGAPLTIRINDLNEAVEHAEEGNLDGARSEFTQFMMRYVQGKDAVRERAPALADRIDAAALAAQRELDENDSYLRALQTLQQAVADANAQLGN